MPSLKLGVGVREDVITLWEELDEARNTLAEIQALQCEVRDSKTTPSKSVGRNGMGRELTIGTFSNQEPCTTSTPMSAKTPAGISTSHFHAGELNTMA